MDNQQVNGVSEMTLTRPRIADWDNYFKETLVEIRRLLAEQEKRADTSV